MRSFSFNNESIKSKTITCASKGDIIYDNLKNAHNMIEDIVELIYQDDEIKKFDYDRRTNELEAIRRIADKLPTIGNLCSEYSSYVDSKYYKSIEHTLNDLSKVNLEQYQTANTLGVTGITREATNSKNMGHGEVIESIKGGLNIYDVLGLESMDTIMSNQLENMKKSMLEGADKESIESINLLTEEDLLKQMVTKGQIEFTYRGMAELSLVIDMIPVIGDIKGVCEAIFGIDLITGRNLTLIERGLSLISIMPLVIDSSALIKTLSGADTAIDGMKALNDIKKMDGFKGILKEIAGEKLDDAIVLFGKEFLTNVSMYSATNFMQKEFNMNPLMTMFLYQVSRTGLRSGFNIITEIKKYGIVDSANMAKNAVVNTLGSKWQDIVPYFKGCDELGDSVKITLTQKIYGIGEVIIRKEDLTPFQLYLCKGNKCFKGKTKVMTEYGLKRIDSIKEGDYILSYCEDTNNIDYKKVIKPIIKYTKEFIVLNIEDNEIETTPVHLFRTEDGKWTAAKDLLEGEGIIDCNGKTKYIKEKTEKKYKEYVKVYNLEIEEYHTYFVGEDYLLVHNEYSVKSISDIYIKEVDKLGIEDIAKNKMKLKFEECIEDAFKKNKFDLEGIDKNAVKEEAIVEYMISSGDALWRAGREGDSITKALALDTEELVNLGSKWERGQSFYGNYVKNHMNTSIKYMPEDKYIPYKDNLITFMDNQKFEYGSEMAAKLEKYKSDIKNCGDNSLKVKDITNEYLNNIEIDNPKLWKSIDAEETLCLLTENADRVVPLYIESPKYGKIDYPNVNALDYNKTLTKQVGPPPKGMIDPHAHHICFKIGNGAEQKRMAAEMQNILYKDYGIDPITGKEVLCWAPNRVKGQHSTETLKLLYDDIIQAKMDGALYDEIVDILDEHKEIAAGRI